MLLVSRRKLNPKGPSTRIQGIYPKPWLRFLMWKSYIPYLLGYFGHLGEDDIMNSSGSNRSRMLPGLRVLAQAFLQHLVHPTDLSNRKPSQEIQPQKSALLLRILEKAAVGYHGNPWIPKPIQETTA